jgi:hypothetical protein
MKRFTRTTWRDVLSEDWAEVERSRFIDHESGISNVAAMCIRIGPIILVPPACVYDITTRVS